MQKRDWKYRGRFKQHLVELLHLPESDRAVVKLNGEILFDETFSTGKDKIFSFFIDDEFCEIKLIAQKNGQYVYELVDHQFSTTQYGKRQKWYSRLQKVGVIGGIIALLSVFSLPIVYYTWFKKTKNNDFRLGGMTAPALVIRIEPQIYTAPSDSLPMVQTRLYFSYSYLGRSHTAETMQWLYYRNDTVYTPSGLPLLKDDEFDVLFAPDHPIHGQLRLDHPSDLQLSKYWLDAREKCVQNQLHLPLGMDKITYCDCLLYELVNQYDLAAFGQFYHQFTPPMPGLRYNRATYQQFMNQRDIRILQSNCMANPLRDSGGS